MCFADKDEACGCDRVIAKCTAFACGLLVTKSELTYAWYRLIGLANIAAHERQQVKKQHCQKVASVASAPHLTQDV